MTARIARRYFNVLLTTVASIAVSPEVFAQATNEPGIKLEEIVVTATRRAELLREVPMSIDVASGKALEDLNLFDFKDVAALSPGLQLTNTVGRNNVASLRGVAYDPDTGAPPAVDFYFNELPVDVQTVLTAIYDVEQIEILKGPQGSLRGRTSPAGAITLRTRQPNMSDVEGHIEVTGTTAHAQNIQAAVSTPLVSNVLAVRVAGLFDRNRLNRVRNVTTGLRSKGKTESGRLSFRYEPSENFSSTLTYQYLQARNRQYQQVVGAGNQPSLFAPDRSGPAFTIENRGAVQEGSPQFDNNTHIVSLNGEWKLPHHTLAFVTGYQDTLLRQRNDLDSANAVPGYNQLQRVRTPYKTFTAEARLSSDYDGFWNYMLGFYYNHSRSNVTVSQLNNQFFSNAVPPTPFPPAFGFVLPINVDLYIPNYGRDISGFIANTLKFNDSLKLEIAARYTSVHIEQQSVLTTSSSGAPALFVPPFMTPPLATIRPANAVRNSTPFTGAASFSYKINEDTTAYAAYGRAYRRGSAQVAVTTPLDDSLIVTKPEHSDAVELGFKGDLLDKRVNYSLSAYYQTFSNYISRGPSVSTASARNGIVDATTNLNSNGRAKGKGIEGNLAAKLQENWSASVGLSYNSTKYKNALLPCNDYNGDGIPDAVGTPTVPAGQQVAFCVSNERINPTANFAANAQSEYYIDMGKVQPFVRGLFTYRPGFASQTFNYDFPSVANLNLYLGVRSQEESWSVTFFARNIFDSQKITAISQANALQPTLSIAGGAGTPFDSGYRTVSTTTPREWGLTLQYRF